jgi:hypothetical protein
MACRTPLLRLILAGLLLAPLWMAQTTATHSSASHGRRAHFQSSFHRHARSRFPCEPGLTATDVDEVDDDGLADDDDPEIAVSVRGSTSSTLGAPIYVFSVVRQALPSSRHAAGSAPRAPPRPLIG